jgi:hypothetical protein
MPYFTSSVKWLISSGQESVCLVLNPKSTPQQLYDHEQATKFLWASRVLPVNWETVFSTYQDWCEDYWNEVYKVLSTVTSAKYLITFIYYEFL